VKRLVARALVLLGATFLALLVELPARAAIPADYQGKPFDPALAGGAGIIPATVKAGPYPIPGRLDFVNYDLGGEMVSFHAGDHLTNKEGGGYRTDMPVATFSKTSPTKPDVYYGTGTAMDGMPYPNATGSDFYIGAVQVNDWFDFTVDVKTAGMYTLSSTWSSGNGPPGGEGGDGTMGLQVFVNGTKLADWKDSFPNYQTTANFHNWKPYPSFATIALEAGLQLIKLQSTSKHLNLDYVDFELVGGGGNTGTAGAGGTAASAGGASNAGAGATSSAGDASVAGSSSTAGSPSTAGAADAGGATNAAGGPDASAGSSNASAGATVNAAAGASSSAPASNSTGCSCALPGSEHFPTSGLAAGALLALAGLLGRSRRRRR
jgi:MYXO-CTERM domain-containing protein